MGLLKLTIEPRRGRRPTFDKRVASGERLVADVVVDDQGIVRVLGVNHLERISEGTARLIQNCEQGHWGREIGSPILAEALGFKGWGEAFAALQASEAEAGRRTRAGRIRCEIVGREG